MNKPTYQQQFDKLTEAYIANKVEPHISCACFVGNLLDGKGNWAAGRTIDFDNDNQSVVISDYGSGFLSKVMATHYDGFYHPIDIVYLESCFLNSYYGAGGGMTDMVEMDCELATPINEDALFVAFEKTLDLLKQIHISKGEVIDETPIFKKRQLATV